MKDVVAAGLGHIKHAVQGVVEHGKDQIKNIECETNVELERVISNVKGLFSAVVSSNPVTESCDRNIAKAVKNVQDDSATMTYLKSALDASVVSEQTSETKTIADLEHLAAYAVTQLKCKAPSDHKSKARITTELKQAALILLKITVLIVLLAQVGVYILRNVTGVDEERATSIVSSVVEGCLGIVIGVSLIYKFDTTGLLLERMNTFHVAVLILLASILVSFYVNLKTNFKHSVLTSVVVLVVAAAVCVALSISHVRNASNVSALIGLEKRRQRIPNLTDTSFICMAAYLVIFTSLSKLTFGKL